MQIYPRHVKSILKHFPEWKDFEESFMDSVKRGMLFNLTDFETGIRYDFMTYRDSDYNWTAFQRRKEVEFFKIKYYEKGEITETHWAFYRKHMEEKIRKDWSERFRRMMRENDWTYEEVAKMGNFKNGKVIEAIVSRGLPSFAKLSVVIYEQNRKRGICTLGAGPRKQAL